MDRGGLSALCRRVGGLPQRYLPGPVLGSLPLPSGVRAAVLGGAGPSPRRGGRHDAVELAAIRRGEGAGRADLRKGVCGGGELLLPRLGKGRRGLEGVDRPGDGGVRVVCLGGRQERELPKVEVEVAQFEGRVGAGDDGVVRRCEVRGVRSYGACCRDETVSRWSSSIKTRGTMSSS